MLVVSDTSPISSLLQIGRAELLRDDHFDFNSKSAMFWRGLISTTSSDLLLYLLGTASFAFTSVGSFWLVFSPVARSARISTRNCPVSRPADGTITYWPFWIVVQAAWRWPPVRGTKVIMASSSGEASSAMLPLTAEPAGEQPGSSIRQASSNAAIERQPRRKTTGRRIAKARKGERTKKNT